MRKLTPVQIATMEFCKKQIDEARKQNIDLAKVKKKEYANAKKFQMHKMALFIHKAEIVQSAH